MFVIAGLGNPGKKYENTRHNMGFRVIDAIAANNDIKVNKLKHKALVGDGRISGQKVLLVKPQTYMNLSGQSLREIVNYYNVDIEDVVVIYDDFDTDMGALRIRKKGSAGSHNGMKSVVSELQSQDFPRIRVGIGESGNRDWVNFVIGNMNASEEELVSAAVDQAAKAVEVLISDGIDMAMNQFNTKKKKKAEAAKTGSESEPSKEQETNEQKGND